ncbi:MAG: mucoidy inhibitor MuiA family protein [Microcoleaceae cyanobacterium]
MIQRCTLETQITEVTVYADQAKVTRRGQVQLNGSVTELLIPGLPNLLKAESLRAIGRGTHAVNIVSLRTEKVFATQPVYEKAAQIVELIRQLDQQKRTLKDQLNAVKLQQGFINQLSEHSVMPFSENLALQNIGLKETREFLNFLGKRYGEYATLTAQLEAQHHELEKQLEALRKQLKQLQQIRPTESVSVVVIVANAVPSEFELELSYSITQASWQPLYDLRVSPTGDRLHLTYLAEITQTTGEDWQNASLTLSTAKPGLGTLPPKLDPWYIDISRPQPMPLALKRRELGFSADGEMSAIMSPSAIMLNNKPESVPAEILNATVIKDGSVVTFNLDGNSNIPNDGNPHQVTVFRDDYLSHFEYLAIPRLVSFAYLQAAVMNPETGVTLLPGKANLFRGNTFMGNTELENIAPGQRFKVNLGIDEGVKIERELIERQVDKKLIGGQRRIVYAYRISMTNLQNLPYQMILKDQLPVSRDEQIKVKLLQARPRIELGEMGGLEWSIILAPKAREEVYYQFVVEHAPELTLIGLNI